MPPNSGTGITAYIKGDTKGLERAAKRARSTIAGIGKGFAGIVAGGAAIAGVRELDQLASASLRAANEIGKASKTAGIGARALQEYRVAGQLAGESVAGVDAALGRYNRRLGEARNGNKAYAETFRRMGVDINDTNEQALAKTFKFLGGITDEATRTSYATKVFGDDARRMALLVQGGADSLEAAKKQARDLGLVLDGDLVRSAEKAQDKLTLMERQLDVELHTTLLKNVDGFIQFKTLMNDVSRFAVTFAARIGEGADALDRFFDRLPGTTLRADASLDDLLVRRERLVKSIYNALEGAGKASKGLDSAFIGVRNRAAKRVDKFQEKAAELARDLLKLDATISKRRSASSLAPVSPEEETPDETGFSFSGKTPGVPSLKRDALLKESQKALDRIAEISERAATPIEKIKNQLVEIDELKAFAETPEQVAALTSAAQGLEQEMQALKDSTDDWKQASIQASSAIADGLARAVVYGDNFSDTLKNIVKQLAFRGLSDLIFSFLPGGSGSSGGFLSSIFGGARAAGGPVTAGKAYLVGERGPELFAPSTSGQIIPNGAGMAGRQIVQNFIYNGVDRTEVAHLLEATRRSAMEGAVSVMSDALSNQGI